jgi:hypothetical protein
MAREDAMSAKQEKAPVNRRGFLKAIGGTTAVAASAVAPGMIGEAQAMNPGNEEKKARYRESDHVKAFYRTNRY